MMKTEKLNRISTVEALTQTFAREIINATWEPGEQCKDTVLAEQYGVSRNSVREAFAILVEQGLLKKKANRGYFVPVFSVRDVRELYEARMLIELEAIEVRTKNREVTQEMHDAIEALCAMTTDDMRSDILEADMRFHMELVRGLNNNRVLEMMKQLYMEIQVINHQPHNFFPIDFIIKEHEKIVDAILSGDVENARRVIREHLVESIDRQIAEMEEKPGQGAHGD